MVRSARILFLFICVVIIATGNVSAQEYVMPYPGFMPGHPLYKISETADTVQQWWSFGSFARFKHHLALADKKLIEAKTLLEYKQYFLATKAVTNYEYQLRLANKFLGEAQNEGKDISEKKVVFRNAITKHREILERLKYESPKEVFWNPEREVPQTIEIEKILNKAIELGKECEEK